MPPSATQHSWRDHSPGVHVTAGIAVRDDTIASDDGFTGLVVKQDAPGIDTPRADLNLVASGKKYYVLDTGEVDIEIPVGLNPAKGDKLWIDPATNVLSKGGNVPASLVTGIVGNNNAIRWTARDPDRLPTVQLVDPAGNSQALAVDVDGNAIIVSLATSAGGAITSTAAQVIAAVNEHDGASALALAANEGASSGAGVVAAAAAAPLAGGVPGALEKVGKVRYVAPERGLTTGLMTVGFDARKDF